MLNGHFQSIGKQVIYTPESIPTGNALPTLRLVSIVLVVACRDLLANLKLGSKTNSEDLRRWK